MHIFMDGVVAGDAIQLIAVAAFSQGVWSISMTAWSDCLQTRLVTFVDFIIVIVLLQRLWLYTILNATQCSTAGYLCRCTRER